MNHEAVLCLLKHGADINLPDAKGHTALRYLAMDGDANIGLMDLLVRKGGTLGQKPLLTLPNTNKEHRTAVKRLLRRV
jgi:ankyrin repeat protein